MTSPSSPLSVSQAAIIALTSIRLLIGTSALFIPLTTFKIVLLPLPTSVSLLLRLIGLHEIVSGELLWTAKADFDKGPSRKQEVRRTLWANVAVDGMEAGAVIHAAAMGMVPRNAASLLGTGAVASVGLVLMGLSGFVDEKTRLMTNTDCFGAV